MRRVKNLSDHKTIEQIEKEYKLFLKNLFLLEKEQNQLIAEFKR